MSNKIVLHLIKNILRITGNKLTSDIIFVNICPYASVIFYIDSDACFITLPYKDYNILCTNFNLLI